MSGKVERPLFRFTSWGIRLSVAVLIALLAGVLSSPLELELRILLAYDLGVGAWLALMTARIAGADAAETRELAEQKETSNGWILTLAGIFSLLNLAGIGFLLHRSQARTPLIENVHHGLSILAIFLTWLVLHFIFGIHYARLYYDESDEPEGLGFRKGLDFPDGDFPDFLDFMYYSFTIAVCYQTSDVTIRSRAMRRVTLAHALLSFLNVTCILGLVVEIVSTLI